MEIQKFSEFMDAHDNLKNDLFICGFLVTDKKLSSLDEFPFYGNWRTEVHSGYYFYAHRLTGMHIYEDASGNSFFLLGHAYDPFAMEYREDKLLQSIAAAYGTGQYLERINDLTGVFVYGDIAEGKLRFLVDPAGMQSACYGKVEQNFYISSHPQLIGDLCNLTMDPLVRELVDYKWYGRVMGPYLPGDMTPFGQVKRIVPDILYAYRGEISHRRFWPLESFQTARTDEQYQQVIREAADILRNNMKLVSEKWQHPWISLTGGIDSNTTFAAANGCLDRFETFSYVSAEKEIPDAEAAKKISDHFGLKHHEYQIPGNAASLNDFEAIREVLMHNNGYVAYRKENELRKRVYLRENAQCDVEVKSWVSETIRAYWYKHYGRKSMPGLSPRLYRNLYKIFLTNRSLAHKVDRIFAEYIQKFEYDKIPDCYPAADMHYNEVTWGSWGGLNISEMKYCFDITIIYNNRRFLDLLFRVPLDQRISDQHHLDMKRYLCPELADMNIRVKNLKETDFRAFALNVIFTINSHLPF